MSIAQFNLFVDINSFYTFSTQNLHDYQLTLLYARGGPIGYKILKIDTMNDGIA